MTCLKKRWGIIVRGKWCQVHGKVGDTERNAYCFTNYSFHRSFETGKIDLGRKEIEKRKDLDQDHFIKKNSKMDSI